MGRKTNWAKKVATALCQVDKFAGQSCDVDKQQTIPERVANLLKETVYGPYVAEGDPNEWSGNPANTLATIYMEQKGTPDDCNPPLDYYGTGSRNGIDVSCAASRKLDSAYIEFVNAAVACVHPD
jgi:hypothetical protein